MAAMIAAETRSAVPFVAKAGKARLLAIIQLIGASFLPGATNKTMESHKEFRPP